MARGFTITKAGKKLLAKLVATKEELSITRVMVGKGEVQQGQIPEQFTDLIQPVAQATSTIPVVKNGVISFIVEYRNDLNGGLQEGFWLKEFGVFAKDGEKEILLYYASLGEYPQYIEVYENGKVNVKKYPVSIIVTDDIKVTIAYAALAFVTEERMKEFVEIEALPYLEDVLAESENEQTEGIQPGFMITVKGRRLLAKLVAGEQLEITRIMVGSGNLGEESPAYFDDLIQPVAQATSTEPITEDNVVSFVVEYRSDLNGGLPQSFWINEFGVFARDGEEEILLYYATLGDFPQYVMAYKNNGAIDVRRYPVSIMVSDTVKVVLAYPALSFMTAEEVRRFLTINLLPEFLLDMEKKIQKHNEDENAHPKLKTLLDADLKARIERLENALFYDIKENPFLVTFETLNGIVLTKGVWNKSKKRLEC